MDQVIIRSLKKVKVGFKKYQIDKEKALKNLLKTEKLKTSSSDDLHYLFELCHE